MRDQRSVPVTAGSRVARVVLAAVILSWLGLLADMLVVLTFDLECRIDTPAGQPALVTGQELPGVLVDIAAAAGLALVAWRLRQPDRQWRSLALGIWWGYLLVRGCEGIRLVDEVYLWMCVPNYGWYFSGVLVVLAAAVLGSVATIAAPPAARTRR